jgi:hypothetical protein
MLNEKNLVPDNPASGFLYICLRQSTLSTQGVTFNISIIQRYQEKLTC